VLGFTASISGSVNEISGISALSVGVVMGIFVFRFFLKQMQAISREPRMLPPKEILSDEIPTNENSQQNNE
jgi:hypothetical protein